MSTGGTGGNPIWGFKQGATNAQPSVDQSDDPDPKGTAAGYVPDQSENKSLLGSLKEALKPGDTKRQQQQQQGLGHMGDFTRDGRHGGVEETMMRGHRDYDESHRDGMKNSGVLESMMPGQKTHENKEKGGILGAMKSAAENMPSTMKKAMGGQDSGLKSSGGITGKTERNSKFDKFPATENYLGPRPGEDQDSATRVSAFDSQGSVGHQFSSEGNIGGTAQKVGGPFSKEGVIGRQFTDKGSVGGKVQDTMGQGDATRKGT
ncbi:uncharacterized protein GGS22DRAFT_188355 [Annulohypoxylon maeteangense]|uniref:uncharacterized protein n=1 Tax=Annulohypoxylon maeteangense TaxID=1927788 RepID=UPI002007E2D6|nr:uncharacterized protein GGS22DRAFT_188355 [Annulohypoxylon maeteangense]KAI0885069.1 hypothetical protein GGS22DRAFT_188355 [Annulohypoxylon maeteangense]